MVFFEQQALCQRHMRWLYLAFYVGLVLLGAVFSLATFLILRAYSHWGSFQGGALFGERSIHIFIGLFFGYVIFFAGLSLLKIWSLRLKTGSLLARELGAQPVLRLRANDREWQLLNIVEEMAIAAGAQVPRVFIVESEQANAMALGKEVADSVVVLTRKLLEILSRDELQAVIAHEFSHILSGDMRLNMKMVGYFEGFLIFQNIGSVLLNSRTRRWHYKKSKETFLLMVLGLIFALIGAVGKYYTRWIKALLSRQREFHADAVAVQFTRNALAVASALYRIDQTNTTNELSPNITERYAHCLIIPPSVEAFGFINTAKCFAAHPPTAMRIERIYPRFDPRTLPPVPPPPISRPSPSSEVHENAFSAQKIAPILMGAEALQEGALSIDYAFSQAFHREVSPEVIAAISDPQADYDVIVALSLSRTPATAQAQIAALRAAQEPLSDSIAACYDFLKEVPIRYFPTLLDLALPIVREVGRQQTRIDPCLQIVFDRHPSLLIALSHARIYSELIRVAGLPIVPKSPMNIVQAENWVLSMMAYLGQKSADQAQTAANLANRYRSTPLVLFPQSAITPQKVKESLLLLAQQPNETTLPFARALVAIAKADQRFNDEEWVTAKMVLALLGCPMSLLGTGKI